MPKFWRKPFRPDSWRSHEDAVDSSDVKREKKKMARRQVKKKEKKIPCVFDIPLKASLSGPVDRQNLRVLLHSTVEILLLYLKQIANISTNSEVDSW